MAIEKNRKNDRKHGGKKKYLAPELKKYVFLKKEFLKFEGMSTPMPC